LDEMKGKYSRHSGGETLEDCICIVIPVHKQVPSYGILCLTKHHAKAANGGVEV